MGILGSCDECGMAGSHREHCSQIKPTPDFCPGCGAQPMNGDPVLHDELCQHEHPDLVCGHKLGRGDICAVRRPCPEHDTARAKLQLQLACGYIHAGGRGDHLVPMAERARVRIEELVEIINGQARERKERQVALEEQFKKHRAELAAGREAWQANYLELLTSIGVADDVARGRDAVEACREVVEISNERCDRMLKTEAMLDENARVLGAWEQAASMFSTVPIMSPADLAERIRAMVGQRDATAAARDQAIDKLGEKGDEIVSLRKLLEETENQRRDEVQAWQAAAGADQLVDIQSPEALMVRLRDLLATRAQLQDKVAKIVEVMCGAGRGKMAVEDDVADLVRQHAELVDEMVRGGDPSAVMESVAALQDDYNPKGSAASSRIETGERAPEELRDAFLDAVAQETADRVFAWLVTGKLPGGTPP